MGQAEPHRSVPSVLVIASDPNIESLVGELVAFAGYRPVYDVTVGAAGESVRRVRPDVTLLDTALNKSVVRACLDAADEVGSRPVLMSSTASDSELVEEARVEGCLHFPLPGGPKPLERVLELALSREPRRHPPIKVPRVRDSPVSGSVHPALCAALASVARARALSLRAQEARFASEVFRGEVRETLEATRRSQAALRAAVTDYARQLKSARIAEEDALTFVHDAIAECANIVGADAAAQTVLAESEAWAREVYRAA